MGLACAHWKQEGEKGEGNSHMVRKEVAVGKLCLGKKKVSLPGDLREERNDKYRHRLVAFNLFIIHMHYEHF